VTLKRWLLNWIIYFNGFKALNSHIDISEETKEQVKAYATKVRVRSLIYFKGFRSQKSTIIGVIIPNIEHQFTSTY
jgi:LacI family transcriptional regulator